MLFSNRKMDIFSLTSAIQQMKGEEVEAEVEGEGVAKVEVKGTDERIIQRI